MDWNEKYWDMVCNLFLTPKYMGWKPIRRKLWHINAGTVTVPVHLIAQGAGALYSRVPMSTGSVIRNLMESQEEILNHVFNITFAIGGDEIIEQLFLRPFRFSDNGPFESLGREIKDRYCLPENFTQQDAMFVSDQSIIAVELKLGSRSSPGQIMKYAALIAHEERRKKQKVSQIGLMFIVPERAIETHWKYLKLTDEKIDQTYFDAWRLDSNRKELANIRDDEVASVLNRMQLALTSWKQFDTALGIIQASFSAQNCADQTVRKLLGGLRAQIHAHRGTDLGGKVRRS